MLRGHLVTVYQPQFCCKAMLHCIYSEFLQIIVTFFHVDLFILSHIFLHKCSTVEALKVTLTAIQLQVA